MDHPLERMVAQIIGRQRAQIEELHDAVAEANRQIEAMSATMNKMVDHVSELVRQNCRVDSFKPGPPLYSDMCISTYEDAIDTLVEAGIMRDIGKGRYVFVEDLGETDPSPD